MRLFGSTSRTTQEYMGDYTKVHGTPPKSMNTATKSIRHAKRTTAKSRNLCEVRNKSLQSPKMDFGTVPLDLPVVLLGTLSAIFGLFRTLLDFDGLLGIST